MIKSAPSQEIAPNGARQLLSNVRSKIANYNTVDLTGILTVFLLMLYGGSRWYILIPITILGVGMLLHRPLLKDRYAWLCATAILIIGNAVNWHTIDNHKYLITYWTIAIATACWTSDPASTLRKCGQSLIALAFAFAVLWKVLSPDYISGEFFHHALLTDRRFAIITRILGGLSPQLALENSRLASAVTRWDMAVPTIHLHSVPGVVSAATFLTWWTLAIEILIAILFLLPRAFRITRFRDFVLISFLLSTYAIAPVIGFGWVLAIMGLGQTERSRTSTRLAYVMTFVFLQLYRIPWKSVFLT